MKASTIALIAIAAAILILGTVFVLTLPKEGWTGFRAMGGTTFQPGGENGAAETEPRLGPATGHDRGWATRGPARGFGMRRAGRGGPGGFFMLALLAGMGIGFASFKASQRKPNGKEDS
jgi:hypothetical protein